MACISGVRPQSSVFLQLMSANCDRASSITATLRALAALYSSMLAVSRAMSSSDVVERRSASLSVSLTESDCESSDESSPSGPPTYNSGPPTYNTSSSVDHCNVWGLQAPVTENNIKWFYS